MSSEARIIRQYAELVRAGHQIDLKPEQFTEETRLNLNHLIAVTNLVGGRLAPTLDRFAKVLLTREQSRSELELAVAAPNASTRLVLSLPVLVFVGAGIAGIPIFQVLAQPSAIWISLILGTALFALGSRWTKGLLTKAKPRIEDPGLSLDLLAVAVGAGLPLQSAIEVVERQIGSIQTSELQELDSGTGVALNELLMERGNHLRLEQFTQDRLRIQKASVSVLWPLGITVLPAFVLIAIIPVGAALIQNQ